MKRPLSNTKALFTILLFLVGMISYAQTGFVSGVINDKDSLPLPGVNITIKGKGKGTQTDFDGNYRLKCEVGDVLIISYIGQQTREVKVTLEMFGEKQFSTAVKNTAVSTILDTTYQTLVRKNLPSFLVVPNIEESGKTHNGRRYLNVDRIKEISKTNNKVKLTYFPSDVYFEVGGSSLIGMQFVQERNLPETQNTFAQGLPINGTNTYFGPETNISFSYGPRLNTLEFDGSSYPFDINGSLVTSGSGNGKTAINYDNNPFKTVLKTSNNLFFNFSTDEQFIGFDYLSKSGRDLYNEEQSKFNNLSLDYHNTPDYDLIQWKVNLKHIRSEENQPNLNGFQNNLLLNSLATPISFDNSQGGVLMEGGQRSFSPASFNNPIWLLNSNRNQVVNDLWLAALRNQFYISDNVTLKTKFSYTLNSNDQQFGLLRNTVGYIDGYSSDKVTNKDVFDANINIDWDQYMFDSNFTLVSSLNYNNENLKYRLSESTSFEENTFINSQNTSTINRDLSRAIFRWHTRIDYRFLEHNATASIINNSFTSTRQNNKWFLPSLQVKYEFGDLINSDFLSRLNLSASIGKDINYLNLFYDNQSHNSLRITPEQSFGYTANNDLFASDDIDLEDKKSYELNLDLGFNLNRQHWNLNTTYFSNTINGSVFPVWTNDKYELQNVANIQNSGIEWSLDGGIYDYEGIRFTPKIVFSTYRTKVLDLLTDKNAIPIAGFSSISKNLIKDQPAGVLVGSAYLRDNQNAIVLDSEGNPLISPNLEIIGDPTPDFNLGFSSTLQWKGIQLDFLIDYQKGGDVWNGTQNVLNYLGTSQKSAIEREIDNTVFERYQRNGFDGVAEDAIVDGSYLNIKSVQLSYETSSDDPKPFFRQFKIGVYGTNLFMVSKFRGASPYSSLFDQNSSQGLHFFNSPLISEIGMKINIKI